MLKRQEKKDPIEALVKSIKGKAGDAKKKFDESGGNYWNGKRIAFEEILPLVEKMEIEESPPKTNWLMFWLGVPVGQGLLVLFLKFLELL